MNTTLGLLLISTLFGSSVLMFLMMTLRFDTTALSDVERHSLLFGFGYRQRGIAKKCLSPTQLRIYWALRQTQSTSLGVSLVCILLSPFMPSGLAL